MGGTFYVAPTDFEQLYIIQSDVLRVNVGLLYVLMKHRTTLDYDNVFYNFKKLINWNMPEYIIIDFEIAVIAALKDDFKTTKIKGCGFRFVQAVWRNIDRLRLIREYKKNSICF